MLLVRLRCWFDGLGDVRSGHTDAGLDGVGGDGGGGKGIDLAELGGGAIGELVEERISENECVLSARLDVDYLAEQFGLNFPHSEDYDTLA